MSVKATLPDEKRIAALLSNTLGKQVQAKQHAGAAAPPGDVTAIYTDDQGAVVAACLCDIKLAFCLGAAFTLLPPNVALEMAAKTARRRDATRTGRFPPG